MTQPPDLPTGLPPEQETVRRLLADARHDGPTPPEVVARLDATLASLAAEREPSPAVTTTDDRSAPVVDLAARRRRLAGTGLLAAAAVVVAGVALGPVLQSMQGSSDEGSASSGDVATSQRELGESDSGSDSGGSAAEEEGMGQDPKVQLSPGPAGYPELFTFDAELDEDLTLLRDASPAPSASGSSRATVCEVPDVGRGRQVVAEIDGTLGLVVFRRPDGASQQVDLYVCDDPTVLRTLTLPAP